MLRSAARFLLLSVLLTAWTNAASADDLDGVRSALKQGDYDQALNQVGDYLDAHPDDTQARFLRGLALARAGRTDAAIDVFSQLAEDYPDLAQPRNNLGVLYAQQQRYEEARRVLEDAVRINPEHAPAQENLGDVYVSLARRAYDRASQLEETNTAVRAKLQRLDALLSSPDTDTIVKKASQSRTASKPKAAAMQEVASGGTAAADRDKEATRAAVGQAVRDWAQAWSDQDVDAYLDAYAWDFDPQGGQSRGAWRRERSARVAGPDFIRVQIADLEIELGGSDSAVARFTQTYRSDSYHDRVEKTLRLKREGSKGWRILREKSD